MTCSDSKIFTTWSNLKHSSISKKITRHPSGNNNTIPNLMNSVGNSPFRCVKNVSQSLPDLTRTKDFKQSDIPLNISVSQISSLFSNTIQILQANFKLKNSFPNLQK